MVTGCRDAGSLIRETAGRLRTAGIEQPGLEAELLVALALGTSRVGVLTHPEMGADEAAVGRWEELLRRREAREPLAHIRGYQEFYGREFLVGPQVLIPRPETEMLVEFALEKFSARERESIIDFGAGSGCIGISIACELPGVHVTAVDCSEEALFVARENAGRLGVADRVAFVRACGLDTVRPESASMIVSNPPYIPTDEIDRLQPEVREYEPHSALDGGADGLTLVRRIGEQSLAALRAGGWLAVEVGMGQAEVTASMFRQAGYEQVGVRSDLAGIGRVVAGQKP